MDKTAQDLAYTVALKQRLFAELQKEAAINLNPRAAWNKTKDAVGKIVNKVKPKPKTPEQLKAQRLKADAKATQKAKNMSEEDVIKELQRLSGNKPPMSTKKKALIGGGIGLGAAGVGGAAAAMSGKKKEKDE